MGRDMLAHEESRSSMRSLRPQSAPAGTPEFHRERLHADLEATRRQIAWMRAQRQAAEEVVEEEKRVRAETPMLKLDAGKPGAFRIDNWVRKPPGYDQARAEGQRPDSACSDRKTRAYASHVALEQRLALLVHDPSFARKGEAAVRRAYGARSKPPMPVVNEKGHRKPDNARIMSLLHCPPPAYRPPPTPTNAILRQTPQHEQWSTSRHDFCDPALQKQKRSAEAEPHCNGHVDRRYYHPCHHGVASVMKPKDWPTRRPPLSNGGGHIFSGEVAKALYGKHHDRVAVR